MVRIKIRNRRIFWTSRIRIRYYLHGPGSGSLLQQATLYQERAVFGKMKMDPGKRAQTQNAGEVSSLQWFFSQSLK